MSLSSSWSQFEPSLALHISLFVRVSVKIIERGHKHRPDISLLFSSCISLQTSIFVLSRDQEEGKTFLSWAGLGIQVLVLYIRLTGNALVSWNNFSYGLVCINRLASPLMVWCCCWRWRAYNQWFSLQYQEEWGQCKILWLCCFIVIIIAIQWFEQIISTRHQQHWGKEWTPKRPSLWLDSNSIPTRLPLTGQFKIR